MLEKDKERIKSINREDCLNFESFDLKYNVLTSSPLSIAKDGSGKLRPISEDPNPEFIHNQGYMPTALPWLDIVNEYFNDVDNIEDYTFVDVGVGKGKVILYNLLKKSKYKKYVGIEEDKAFYDICKYNLEKTNIEIDKEVELFFGNANLYDFSKEKQIYFFFYPFKLEYFVDFMNKNLENMKNKNNYLVFIFEQEYEVKDYAGTAVYDHDAVTIYSI